MADASYFVLALEVSAVLLLVCAAIPLDALQFRRLQLVLLHLPSVVKGGDMHRA